MTPSPKRLPVDFLAEPAIVARQLVGMTLLLHGVGGIIVEAEAYDYNDPASHSFTGPKPRNAVMFGPPGHVYIYRSYGVHWCMNFVCRPPGLGAAVLLRALEPTHGIALMRERRGLESLRLLCAGPGRITQALAATGALDGTMLLGGPFELRAPQTPVPDEAIGVGVRIGISHAKERPWRFGLKNSPYLSRKFAL